MVDGAPIDVRGHRVLERQAHELHTVCPPDGFEAVAAPFNDLAFPRPWQAMKQTQHRLVLGSMLRLRTLFNNVCLQPLDQCL